MPPFSGRYAEGRRDRPPKQITEYRDEHAMNRTVVMVDQDGVSNWGHYMAYNRKLAAAFEREEWKIEILCNRSMSPAILNEKPYYLPRLTINSWDIHGFAKSGIVSHVAESELFETFSDIANDGRSPIYVYLYCGSLEMTRIFRRFIEAGLPVRPHVNLFHNAADKVRSDAFIGKWIAHLQWLDANRPLMRVTAPTRQWQAELEESLGIRLPVAVHPSTTVDDSDFKRVRRAVAPDMAPFRVLFPASLRSEKGGNLTLRTLENISAGSHRRKWRCVIRKTGRPDEALDALTRKTEKCIEVVSGELSDERFSAMLSAAHVAVIPYMPEEFAKRTSGLLIDTIYFGLPTVVMDGTWLADIVREYKCGAVVRGANPADVVAAIESIAADYTPCRARARAAAADYFSRNSWQALARSVLNPWEDAAPRTPAARAAGRHTACALNWYRARDTRLRQWFHERKNLLVNLSLGALYGVLTRLQDKGLKKIALFGAGLHTRKLLTSLILPEGIELVCILDDFPQTDFIANVPVISPKQRPCPKVDAIVVSSDSIEEKLYRRARELNIAPVFTLYGKFEEHEALIKGDKRCRALKSPKKHPAALKRKKSRVFIMRKVNIDA